MPIVPHNFRFLEFPVIPPAAPPRANVSEYLAAAQAGDPVNYLTPFGKAAPTDYSPLSGIVAGAVVTGVVYALVSTFFQRRRR